MRTSRAHLLAILTIGLVLLAGCNFPQAQGTPVSGPDLVMTYAAETVQAQLTLAATGLQPTLAPGLPGTSTPVPPGDTPTTSPGETQTPGATTGTPSGEVCDRGEFVEDVTFPDSSEVEPGQQFTKTWLLRNDGTCTWNASYSIVFDSGEAMGAPASVPLTSGAVPPGEEVEVSVTLTAPQEEGTYQGFWMLRNQAGQIFGLGSEADEDFWVKVEVVTGDDGGEVAEETYDFIAQASSAEWVGSGQGEMIDLDYGGADDDPDGVAKIVENVTLENGSNAGKTLLMRPRDMHNGGISGKFSDFRVEDGNVFLARIGFLEDCGEAQVEFQLWYEQDGDLTMLREWSKSCDGKLLPVEVDLSNLDGERVKFILVVLADGSAQDDFAIWSSPRIELD
jgi:hypothetical protein